MYGDDQQANEANGQHLAKAVDSLVHSGAAAKSRSAESLDQNAIALIVWSSCMRVIIA